jgi:hypothetical protein
MGEMYMQRLDNPWELAVVENAGEIPADKVGDTLAAKTEPLLLDSKAQLMMVPITLTFTVGWRALVWKNKETGQFLDLTEEEYNSYLDGGILTYTREIKADTTKNEDTKADAGGDNL